MSNDRHDHEAAKALYQPAKPETELPTSEQAARRRRIMVALWERMSQFFGKKWEENYGSVETGTIWSWQGALSRFTEAEIAGAVKAMAHWKGPFVPTFPEFRDLCETARAHGRVVEAREMDAKVPLLEKLRKHAATPIAKAELARIERISAGDDVETFADSYRKLALELRWGPLAR